MLPKYVKFEYLSEFIGLSKIGSQEQEILTFWLTRFSKFCQYEKCGYNHKCHIMKNHAFEKKIVRYNMLMSVKIDGISY